MESIGDFFSFPYYAVKTLVFNIKEEQKVRAQFYQNSHFQRVDLALKKAYRWCNPYTVCKRFMQKEKKKQIHVYGETPLTELYKALVFCKITPKDSFLDLGCGRGRVCLFVSTYFSCKSVGVDFVPLFCQKAVLASRCLTEPPEFVTKDILSFDCSKATIIYFYSLLLEEEELIKQIEKFTKIKEGAKIITVSFPLSDYSPHFYTLHSFPAVYPWGKTTIFINTK
jgi:hypothetical protein